LWNRKRGSRRGKGEGGSLMTVNTFQGPTLAAEISFSMNCFHPKGRESRREGKERGNPVWTRGNWDNRHFYHVFEVALTKKSHLRGGNRRQGKNLGDRCGSFEKRAARSRVQVRLKSDKGLREEGIHVRTAGRSDFDG